jgi:hypothetical protein
MSQSQSFESDGDTEINAEMVFEFSLEQLTASVRDQLLKDARRLGSLYGSKYAQKKTPLASKPQPPGTQRVW